MEIAFHPFTCNSVKYLISHLINTAESNSEVGRIKEMNLPTIQAHDYLQKSPC